MMRSKTNIYIYIYIYKYIFEYYLLFAICYLNMEPEPEPERGARSEIPQNLSQTTEENIAKITSIQQYLRTLEMEMENKLQTLVVSRIYEIA